MWRASRNLARSARNLALPTLPARLKKLIYIALLYKPTLLIKRSCPETYTRIGCFTRRFCGRPRSQQARGRSGAVWLVRRSAALPKPRADYDRGRPQKRLVMNPIGSDTSGTRSFHFQSQFMHKIEMAHLLESRAIWMRSRLPPCSARFKEMRHVRLIYFWTSQMERPRPGGIGTYRVHRQALLASLSGSIGAQLRSRVWRPDGLRRLDKGLDGKREFWRPPGPFSMIPGVPDT